MLPRVAGVSSYLTGASATFYDMEQTSDDDVKRMELITFPIALLILIIIFSARWSAPSSRSPWGRSR